MNRLFLRLACLALVVTMALRCETGNPLDPDSSGNPPIDNPPTGTPSGSIRGTVTATDSLVIAMVTLTGAGITRTAWATGQERTFNFDDVPPGTYTVTADPLSFDLACQPATADVDAGETVTANIACAQQRPGTIAGTITAGGSPIPGATVYVTRAWARAGSATTDADGAFTFSVPSGGPYGVVANPPGTSCQSASGVVVEEDRTVSVNILCQPVGGISGEIRWASGSGIHFLPQVTLDGPAISRVVQSFLGEFSFGAVPPGDYALTSFWLCQPVVASVQVAHVTSVEIVCNLPDFRLIAGDFFFYLPREDDNTGLFAYTQLGDCPPPLPAENTRRSITIDPGSGRISLMGLDPNLVIVGDLFPWDECFYLGCEETHRGFDGTGSSIRPDGSSIHSILSGTFTVGTGDVGSFHFWGRMTREHRDTGGSLVCTETYEVYGNRILPS